MTSGAIGDDATVDTDEPAYHEWLRWLISNSYIPECPTYKLKALLSRKEESALRMADMAAFLCGVVVLRSAHCE